jgi:hypothetical protein
MEKSATSLPIRRLDGIYTVQLSSGRVMPITKGGEPVHELHPGWSAKCIHGGAGDVRCLELRHADATSAVWYLDTEMSYLTNQFSALQPYQQKALRAACEAHELTLWDQLVCRAGPSICAIERPVDPVTSRDIMQSTSDLIGSISGAERAIVLQRCEDIEIRVGIGPGAPTIDLQRVRGLLATNYVDSCIEALTTGAISVRSPISGGIVSTSKALHLSSGTYAYKLSDEAAGLVFYLIGSGWKTSFLALYLPRPNVAFYQNDVHARWMFEWMRGRPISQAIAEHVSTYATSIAAYLAAPQVRFALTYNQGHLGHHLWNEMTGLEQIVARVDSRHLPKVLIVNAAATEMWGKLDAVFSQLAGRVDRSLRTEMQLLERTYSDRLTLLRPADDHISHRLATRIIDLNEPEAKRTQQSEYEQLRNAGFRIFLLGLRAENRTLVDLADFCRNVVEFLHLEVRRVAVVVDGHNSSTGGAASVLYASHGAPQSSHLAHIERRIADDLTTHFANQPSVRIINLIGKTIASSIFWCNRSEFFITPWGAGLAKYRWICNKPGVVTAGPTYLRTAGHDTIHLYDSQEFMDRPTPLLFTAEADAEDVPDAPSPVPIADNARVNYRVRHEAVFALICQLLGSNIPDQQPTSQRLRPI